MSPSGGGPNRQQRLDAVAVAIRENNLGEAKGLAQSLLADGFEHPILLNLRALHHEDQGRLQDALVDLRRAHVLAPKDYTILNACGLCLARMERLEEALACYDQALAIAANFHPAWFNRGWVLERLGEGARAAESYGKAAELEPANAPAWGSLALLAVRRGDAEGTRTAANRALDLQPDQPAANLALAQIERDNPDAAERRLMNLLSADRLTRFERGLAFSQLGDVLDALDRPTDAFAAYVHGNLLFQVEARAFFETDDAVTIADTLDWLNRWAETVRPEVRSPSPEFERPGAARRHVFLLGFPRSGTTLLETALAAHPDIVSLEERNTLDAAVRRFLIDRQSAERLALATPSDIDRLKEDYWCRVRSFSIEFEGRVFIDKNPFNTLKLPLIDHLFPRANIIFSVRDPRDVVLSCYRRRFSLNSTTFEFLDLTRTAINYCDTMKFFRTISESLPLNTRRIYYERMVKDFGGEAKAICEWIGVDWRPEMIDIASRARRGEIASASSAQIARGLYLDGAGQWRRYKEQLAPVLDMLRPWVEYFGYESD